MKNIQYIDILKQALMITWKNKFLWFFGFLILLGSIGSNVNFNSNDTSGTGNNFQAITSFMQDNPNFFAILSLSLILIAIALFLLRILAAAGMIKSVNDINLYRQLSIGGILVESKKYLWKLLMLEFAIGIVLMLISIVLATPIVYLFSLKAKVLAYSALFIATLIILPIVVLAFYLYRYASFYIVLANKNVKMALESAYDIFVKNMKESLIAGLFVIGSGFLLMFSMLSLCLAAIVVFGILGLVAYFIFAKVGAIVLAVIGAMVLFVVALAVISWYEAFVLTTWLLFFQEIAFEKHQEKKIAEKIEIEGKIPNPEAV